MTERRRTTDADGEDRSRTERAARSAPSAIERCRWCGRPLPEQQGPGRRRTYCKQGCRQQAHMARKLASAHGLGDDDVVVSRETLEELQSRLYCLQAALEDVDRDLAQADDPQDVREALSWVLENARPVAELWVEPRTAVV